MLLAVDGSVSVAETVAEAVNVPAAVGRTTMVNVWLRTVGQVAEREGQLAIARRDAAGGRDERGSGGERLGQCGVRGRVRAVVGHCDGEGDVVLADGGGSRRG